MYIVAITFPMTECVFQTSAIMKMCTSRKYPYFPTEGIGISWGVRGSVGEVWIFSGNKNLHLAILPGECCTQFTVVSIQSRFDTSCFNTNRSHFDTHVKLIRYCKL